MQSILLCLVLDVELMICIDLLDICFPESCLQILQLEKRLQDQFEVRRALETALGYRTCSNGVTNRTSMPQVFHFRFICSNLMVISKRELENFCLSRS